MFISLIIINRFSCLRSLSTGTLLKEAFIKSAHFAFLLYLCILKKRDNKNKDGFSRRIKSRV